jgi:hypothetical protein
MLLDEFEVFWFYQFMCCVDLCIGVGTAECVSLVFVSYAVGELGCGEPKAKVVLY